MKAIQLRSETGPSGLVLSDVEPPALGPGEVRVRVRASALNRADLYQTQGEYPAPKDAPQDIPGLEYAGEVIELGPRTLLRKVGDRVMGLVGGGAFAEQLVAHERQTILIPERLTFEEAAAIPEAFLTAFDALVLQGGMSAGDSVLIHAVTSGVGTAGALLAHAFGARAIGTGRNAEKLGRLAGLGVTLEKTLVVGDPPRFHDEVRKASGGGANVALELAGGDYLPETLRSMAPRGRVVLVGTMAGESTQLGFGSLMGKRLQLVGTVMRSRPLEEKIALARAFEQRLSPMFADGRLRPLIEQVHPMEEAAAALEAMGRNEGVGKRVLAWR